MTDRQLYGFHLHFEPEMLDERKDGNHAEREG